MKLGIVIPCYNEEEVLPETSPRIIALIDRPVALGKIADDSQVFFVDDGSKDRTWALIEALASTSRRVVGIKLSRKRGHQNALIAGLVFVTALAYGLNLLTVRVLIHSASVNSYVAQALGIGPVHARIVSRASLRRVQGRGGVAEALAKQSASARAAVRPVSCGLRANSISGGTRRWTI